MDGFEAHLSKKDEKIEELIGRLDSQAQINSDASNSQGTR